MKQIIFIVTLCCLTSCAIFHPTKFSQKALRNKFVSVKGDSISLQEILSKKENKVIEVYASYCPASFESFTKMLKFQQENPKKKYIFLSVDHSFPDFKRALKDISPKGDFYFIPNKAKGDFAKFIKLKSTPHFLSVDKNNKIRIYKTHKISRLK